MENGDWAHMVNINGQNKATQNRVDIVYCTNTNRIMSKTRKKYVFYKKKIIRRKAICFGWLLGGC